MQCQLKRVCVRMCTFANWLCGEGGEGRKRHCSRISFIMTHFTLGMLPLTFANPDDYDKINTDDKISLGLKDLAPGKVRFGSILLFSFTQRLTRQ